jgi:hypothetical protein
VSTTKLLLSGAMLLVGGSVFAQTSLTCSSEDGGRHYCGADTRRGVQMVRQRSGSACREGYSWGSDSRGVWVDHGCRADFVIGAAGNRDMRGDRRDDRGDYRDRDRNYGTSNAASTLTCSSEDGGRHYCAADTRRGVQMVQQRSGSACREGYSWGTDSRGVWVDHGCRADFAVGAAGRYGGGGYGDRARDRDRDNRYRGNSSSTATSLTCSSDDGGRHYCGADTSRGVQLIQQRSGSACRQGYSWGYDRRGVWVDHGCRADFAIR